MAAGEPVLHLLVRAVVRGDGWTRDAIWRDRWRLDDIARAAQAGDDEARNALCIIIHPHLERIAIGMGIVPRDVPDLVQEALVAAHLNLDRFDPARGSVRTWMTTILARLRLNQLRRRARRVRGLAALAGAAGDGAARHRAGGWGGPPGGGDIAGMLAGLSRRQRQVLTVYAIGGLSARETGRVLGLTEAGVRSIARDARSRLARVRDH
ncbi:MAG TPA: RNA polymerase sigma factor [Candidatus Polarisedimenticolia bacterium]|nr:RNA polymerase sigma factor [Candidatus Polarisedimenticolia bacterium]